MTREEQEKVFQALKDTIENLNLVELEFAPSLVKEAMKVLGSILKQTATLHDLTNENDNPISWYTHNYTDINDQYVDIHEMVGESEPRKLGHVAVYSYDKLNGKTGICAEVVIYEP